MAGSGHTRRELLRTGSGIAATVTAAGVAGCVSSVPGFSSDGDGTPRFATWLPSREALGTSEGGNYRFVSLDVATIRDNESEFSERTIESVARYFGSERRVLPDFEQADHLITASLEMGHGGIVVDGSFAPEEIRGTLESEGYREEASYSGYSIYIGQRAAMGMADGRLVVRTGASDTVAGVRSLIDVGEGEGERLTDANETAELLVSELGDGLFANGTIPPSGIPDDLQVDRLAANGLRGGVSGDTTDVRQVLVYESADSVTTGSVESASVTAGELDGTSVSMSDRTAVVEGSYPTDDLTDQDMVGVAIGNNPISVR